jgi:hypothetical protein
MRRRTEAFPVFDPAIQPNAPEPRASPPAKSDGQAIADDQTPTGNPSGHASKFRQEASKPQMTFQQRLAMER